MGVPECINFFKHSEIKKNFKQMKIKDLNLTHYARIAGLFYLLIIALGATGQIGIRGSIVTMDALSTYQNLVASESLWRIGIIGDLLMQVLDIPVMVILYMLLRSVNKYLALLGVLFNIVQTAVLVANKIVLIIPTLLIGNPEYANAFDASQIKAQVYLLTDIHDFGFGFGLVFFGFACLTYGYLIYRSDYFPNLLGLLVAIAGLCYLINSVALILAPQYSGDVMLALVFSLLGELSFALWLLIKGVKS